MREFATQQINERRGQYSYKPLESADELPKQQFALGEAAGLEMMLRWPEQVIAEHEGYIRELRSQLGDTKDDEVKEDVRARDEYPV